VEGVRIRRNSSSAPNHCGLQMRIWRLTAAINYASICAVDRTMFKWSSSGAIIVACIIAVLTVGCGGTVSNLSHGVGRTLDIAAFNFKIVRVNTEEKIVFGDTSLSAKECCRLIVVTISGAAPMAGDVIFEANDFTVSSADDNGIMKTQTAAGLGERIVSRDGKTVEFWGFNHDPVAMENANGVISRSVRSQRTIGQGDPLEPKLAFILPKNINMFRMHVRTVLIGLGELYRNANNGTAVTTVAPAAGALSPSKSHEKTATPTNGIPISRAVQSGGKSLLGIWSRENYTMLFGPEGKGTYYQDGNLCYQFTYGVDDLVFETAEGEHMFWRLADRENPCAGAEGVRVAWIFRFLSDGRRLDVHLKGGKHHQFWERARSAAQAQPSAVREPSSPAQLAPSHRNGISAVVDNANLPVNSDSVSGSKNYIAPADQSKKSARWLTFAGKAEKRPVVQITLTADPATHEVVQKAKKIGTAVRLTDDQDGAIEMAPGDVRISSSAILVRNNAPAKVLRSPHPPEKPGSTPRANASCEPQDDCPAKCCACIGLVRVCCSGGGTRGVCVGAWGCPG
jgi:hypothetical protein